MLKRRETITYQNQNNNNNNNANTNKNISTTTIAITTITWRQREARRQWQKQKQKPKTTAISHITLLLSSLSPQAPFLLERAKHWSKPKDPQTDINCWCPFCNIAFSKKEVATTGFSWKHFRNRGFGKFRKIEFLGPKRRNPQKSVNMVVSFDLWPLFLFLSRKGVQKSLFCRRFCHRLSYNLVPTSTTNHHKQEIEKGDGYHPLFQKPVLQQKHQKAAKTWNPFLIIVSTESTETTMFIVVSEWKLILSDKFLQRTLPERPQIEGVSTVKCKPWTEWLVKRGLLRQLSRGAWKRRINCEVEAKIAHRVWIREGLNREVQTVNWVFSAPKTPVNGEIVL